MIKKIKGYWGKDKTFTYQYYNPWDFDVTDEENIFFSSLAHFFQYKMSVHSDKLH